MSNRVHVRAPASSANLGAGFDALGVALTLYNHVWMEEWDGCVMQGAEPGVPADERNLIYRAARTLYAHAGRDFSGLRWRQESHIPMTRGLGSSSACLVAGLVGANALLGEPLDRAALLDLAAGLEGHPDNVAPALLGGLAASAMADRHVTSVRVPVDARLRFTVFIPDFELPTETSRGLLPDAVSRADAVYNLSRAALMTAALFSGDFAALRVAAGDRLHQPYRFPHIPGGERVMALAHEAGAYGVCLSGAGPAILAMTEAGFADGVRERVDAGWTVWELGCDGDGVRVAWEP